MVDLDCERVHNWTGWFNDVDPVRLRRHDLTWNCVVTWRFPKLVVPPNYQFNRMFHYKPSIFGSLMEPSPVRCYDLLIWAGTCCEAKQSRNFFGFRHVFLEGGQSIYIVMVCLGVSFCIMTPSQRGPFGRVFPFQKDPTSFFPALESFNLFFCIIFPSVVINLLNNDFCRYHTQLLFGSERMWNIYNDI